jgi:cobyrinic acid a,c-diamide synthase
MIAGTGSGCGKTTITCGILKALMNKGLRTASFKCGPDYIDPMFHSEITGTKSRNLDMFLCGENIVKQLFAENSEDTDISVVEGVMGFYDGLGVNTVDYSSNDLSNKTGTPVILVVNCHGMSLSVAASIKGFLEFSENNIRGVLLNGTNPGMFPMYKELIEKHNGTKVLGFMPHLPEASIESRHLGLVTAQEIDELKGKIAILAENAARYIDLDALVEIASSAPALQYEMTVLEKSNCVVNNVKATKIAIARDKAFCFYYEDSIELLRKLGAEIVPFSPLTDDSLPEDIDGIILGGGYPELYCEKLSANSSMRKSIKAAIEKKVPVYAECGGFMYLGASIEGHKMVNAIKTNSVLTDRLQNFGYARLTADRDNLLCKKGERIYAHEFHYSKSDFDGDAFTSIKISSGKQHSCIFADENMFAGYPHLHLWGNVRFAEAFVNRCSGYRARKYDGTGGTKQNV